MMIKKLRMSNFRAFYSPDKKFHTIQFNPGINLITGDNGAGKTSIIKAIQASLFGPGELQRDEIINDRYNYECTIKGIPSRCSLNLVISDGDNERNIVRAITVATPSQRVHQELFLDSNEIDDEELQWRILEKSSFKLINLVGVELGNHARQFQQYRKSVESLFLIPYFQRILSAVRTISKQYEDLHTTTSSQIEEWTRTKEELFNTIRLKEEKIVTITDEINQYKQDKQIFEKLEDEYKDQLDEELLEIKTREENMNNEKKKIEREYKGMLDYYREIQKSCALLIALPILVEKASEKTPVDKQPLEMIYYKVGAIDGKIELITELHIKYDKTKLDNQKDSVLKPFNGKMPNENQLREAYRYLEFTKESMKLEEEYRTAYMEIPNLRVNISRIRRNLKKIEEELEKIKLDHDSIIKWSEHSERLQRLTKIGELGEKLEALKKEKETIEVEKKELEKQREDILKNLSKFHSTGEAVDECQKRGYALEGLLEEYINNIVSMNMPRISDLANEYFCEVNQKPKTFKGIRITPDFEIELNEIPANTSERWTSISARPSTGETDVIFLCISFAISKLTQTGLLIMDDGIINLDNVYRTAILKLLEKINFEQVILINKESSRNEILKNLSISNSYRLNYSDQEATSKITSGGA